MTATELFEFICSQRSFLCIGLDTDIQRIPQHLLQEDDPVFAFNKAIIDATKDLCVAYKPNIAFYEAMGAAGWTSLEKTLAYIPPTHFTIADAKRGDIGNTSGLYARAFFQTLSFDSITVAPYMGHDSVQPFLGYPGKWIILLGLTSNQGSADFQQLRLEDGQQLFERVIQTSSSWASPDQLMYVVGATQAEHLKKVRALAPDYFFLVPGVGAQGGDLDAVSEYACNEQVGLLVNSSRGIIYAGSGADFAQQARQAAAALQVKMEAFLKRKGFVSPS